MGTTLTGTTPQDTYDSLIKVTDNGPLSSTLKKLTDGLGNDSSLSLSTTAASLSGTLAVTGNATFDTNTLFVDAATNRVGVLTTSPTEPLHVEGNISLAYGSSLKAANATYTTLLETGYNGSSDFVSLYTAGNNAGNATAKITMLANGNVGIGTISPTQKLDVAGRVAAAGTDYHSFAVADGSAQIRLERTGTNAGVNYIGSDGRGLIVYDNAFSTKAIFTADGLCFNGDTAAANALDDYEEGTWTPVFTMGTSGTVTTGGVSGRYTKIGNLVTCTGFANIDSVSSPVGELRIGGLPFTTGTASDSASSLFVYAFGNTTALNNYQAFISAGLTYAIIRGFSNGDQVQNIGANVVGGAGMIFTITYRV